jgi:hypothetical protein
LPTKDPEHGRQLRREHYARNKTVYYERNRIRRLRFREYLYRVKQESQCTLCGEDDPRCLDFHHLGDKSDDVSSLGHYSTLQKLQAEIRKCVVLCRNCHAKLHHPLVPHLEEKKTATLSKNQTLL